MNRKKYIAFLILLFCTVYSLIAQLTTNPEKLKYWNERYDAGIPKLAIAALPVFSADYDLALSVAANIAFKTKRNNKYLSYSYLPITATTNFSDKHGLDAMLATYWLDDLIFADFALTYHNRIDNYWGVGMEAASKNTISQLNTQYHKNWINFYPSINIRVYKRLYAGLIYNFNNIDASETAPGMLEDLYIVSQGTKITNKGLGLNLIFNSTSNKKSKYHLNLQSLLYSNNLGGDFNYKKILFTYKQSVNIDLFSGKLFWTIHTQNSFDDVPWSDMAFLGGENQMLGIPQGKYRDKSLIHAFAEYNYIFQNNIENNPGRHAIALRFGGGTVYGYSNNNYLIMNIVLGYRYQYQPDFNLLIDFGYSENTFASYVGFNKRF